MSKENSSYIASVDIGTTKVALTVAKPLEDKLEIVGFAMTPHKGFHQGQIVDPQEIILALSKVKREVEATTGLLLDECWVTVADNSITTVASKGSLAIKKAVRASDVEEILLATEEAAQVRSDREILHVVPQYYKWNNQKALKAPVGEKTNFLEVQVLVVTGSRRNNQTARECLKGVGLECKGVVATAVAVAEAHIDDVDKAEGIVVVDLGGHQTDLVCFVEGKMVHMCTLPLGGVNFTQDLAIGLKTPQTLAEDIKKNHGAALVEMVSADETLSIDKVRGEGKDVIPVRFVSEILEARSEETLGLLLKTINDAGFLQSIKRGIVLTGGASQLPGLPELGEFTFDIEFKRRSTNGVLSVNPQALGPVMAASIGVLHYARTRQSFEPSVFSLDTFKDKWAQIKNYIENIL
ncbi:MAG: cell division protein FtsA [Bdellovibrionaceae bacterium]|nr:cell division protein FtsA [Pseudobdellovibrionaceae bacterium]